MKHEISSLLNFSIVMGKIEQVLYQSSKQSSKQSSCIDMEPKSLIGSQSVIPNELIADSQSQRYQLCMGKLSKSPRYQYLLIASISFCWVLITFNAMIGSFVFMNPLFECNEQSNTQLQACKKIQQCIITNDFTAVKRNQLYCQKLQIRSTIQSIFAVGCVIGMACLPIISDIIGRRKACLSVLLIGVSAISLIILGIEKDNQMLMIVGMLLAGIFGAGSTALGFILTCDFCSESLRQKCILVNCAMWGFGQMLFYPIYFYMPEWDRYLVFLLLIPISAFFILTLFYLLQSPVYAIFVKKDINYFQQIARKLTKFNKCSQQDFQSAKQDAKQIIQALLKEHKKQIQLKQSLKRILLNKTNLKNCICLMLPIVSFNFFYYGMQGSMERTGYNFGLNMLLVGLHEFLGYLSASFFTKNLRRKKGLIISVIVTGAIGLTFLINFVKQQFILQTVLASLTRLTSVYAYCFIILLQFQILQVQIRSTAIALIDGLGQSGRIIVPYIVNIMNNLRLNTLVLSSIIFLVFGIFPALFLKQTYVSPEDDREGKVKIDQTQEVNI